MSRWSPESSKGWDRFQSPSWNIDRAHTLLYNNPLRLRRTHQWLAWLHRYSFFDSDEITGWDGTTFPPGRWHGRQVEAVLVGDWRGGLHFEKISYGSCGPVLTPTNWPGRAWTTGRICWRRRCTMNLMTITMAEGRATKMAMAPKIASRGIDIGGRRQRGHCFTQLSTSK